MSNWATDFMDTKLVGNINVALVFGLLQFVSTFAHRLASTPGYANRELDPLAREPAASATTRRSADEHPDPDHGPVPRGRRASPSASPSGPAGRHSGATDYYAGGRSFSGFQNGLAISGDYMSAASFLGISGAIALSGYDGFLYSIGFLVAWLVALLLVAELLRNSGRYTMADQLAYRMRQRPVRTAAATSTVVVSIFYLLAQMVGAGSLVALLLGVDSQALKNLTIVGVGLLMIFYVTVGGMKGTTWVQIVKAVLLMTGTILITVLVLAKFGFNLSDLLGAAAENTGKGEAFLQPGPEVRRQPDQQDRLHQPRPRAGARHRRPAAHPDPLLHRADRRATRARRCCGRSALIGSFYLMTLVLGFGAAALLDTGADSEVAASGGNLASPLLAEAVGGGAGLDRRRGAAGADLGGGVRDHPRGGRRPDADLGVVGGARPLRQRVQEGHAPARSDEVRVARIAAFVIGGIAIALAIPAQKLNIAFLVALAFAVAASANLPSIIYNLFWKRFNTRGATWSIYGGLVSCVVLVFFSPVVSGKVVDDVNLPVHRPRSTSRGSRWSNPGIVSIPLGFLFGCLGTVTSREPEAEEAYDELEVRALTGAGAEGAVTPLTRRPGRRRGGPLAGFAPRAERRTRLG